MSSPKFKIGDLVKVIKPYNLKYWLTEHESAIGREFRISHHYLAVMEHWYSWADFSISFLGFNEAWLELINSISCQCDLAKLMARGCQCGNFKKEQEEKSK